MPSVWLIHFIQHNQLRDLLKEPKWMELVKQLTLAGVRVGVFECKESQRLVRLVKFVRAREMVGC